MTVEGDDEVQVCCINSTGVQLIQDVLVDTLMIFIFVYIPLYIALEFTIVVLYEELICLTFI